MNQVKGNIKFKRVDMHGIRRKTSEEEADEGEIVFEIN